MTENSSFRRLLMHPLLWALVYGFMVLYGLYAYWKIPVEVLPRFNFPEVSVFSREAGTTAAELESQIAWPLEGEIQALPNLVDVRSSMGNGTVETDIRFREGTDPEQDLMAVNGAIDRARAQIPSSVQPFAEIMGTGINEVADYSMDIPAADDPANVERAIRANVVPALRALPGVYRVDVYGAGQEALWVQPDLSAMYRYGVSISALVSALQQQVVLDPGGYVTQGHQDVFIEIRSLPTHIQQLEQIPIPAADGPIPLSELARVVRAPVPTLNAALLDRRPSVALIVFKQPDASTIPVTESIQRTLNDTLRQLPAGVSWVSIYNQGHLVHIVGTDLGRNLVIGGLLAIAVLLWVLGGGRGIWILALSIPLSLLLGIACLYTAGQSLNLMTLGALTIAVGLLSDDGIIVLESIYHRWEQGDERWAGVNRGLRDIVGPDITGTLTTVSVFIPLLFVGGLAGLFFIPFALAMTMSLLASLLISISLIPVALGFIKARARTTPTSAGRALDFLRRQNERLFNLVAKNPKLSLGACILLLAGSLAGLVLVPINFLPLPNEGVLLESFTLPPGSSMLDTERVVQNMTRRIQNDSAVAHVFARIGSPSTGVYPEPSYAGEIQITLKPNVNMNSLDEVSNRILKESRTPAVQTSIDTPTIERVGESLSGLPQPFVIDLFGSDINHLRSLSQNIVQRLRPIPALTGIFNNDGYLITELQITPRPGALTALHMTPADLDAQIRPLLNGQIVAEVPEGNLPLALYVRLAGAPDQSMSELARLPIRTSGWTPLGQLADIRMVPTPSQIRHIDGARALEILATPKGPLGSTISSARKAIAAVAMPPGYRIAFGGLYPQLENAALGLGAAAIAAFLLMLAIMILQFDGLLVPGLLLLLIPLAFTGGALALLISGVGLNAIGLIAFLTLVGIGLNHGIVLLYRTRRNEADGMLPEDAVKEAVHVRFRPIALTTLTAILGMLPTALGWGQGAAPEQGLAAVILGGILWSALLSTNLLPALYLHLRRRQLAKEKQA
ncbi:MAG TPA: efflux RND transporter permease subunit [Terracidiphilus sp.]|nr:efflux RND transporter permease subunit [Terracidiphilus sp.]